jgi:hypothetical protein
VGDQEEFGGEMFLFKEKVIMRKYHTSFEEGDVILRNQEYITILGVCQTEDGAEYKIRDRWEDAALIDRNCEYVQL